MKNLKKSLALLLSFAAVFMFFSCATDTEDDENLVVQFNITDSSQTVKSVTMTPPSEYSDKDVHIVFTLDESTPELTYNKSAYNKDASVAEYVDYGTASLYEGAVKIGETCTIKAIAFYVNTDTGKCVTGTWTSTKITISASKTDAAETSSATGASSGDFTFTLAETGNSNLYHYFDTYRTNVFKLNDAHPNVYYQTSFSYKGKGKGNWYLYMRDLNGGLVKKGSENFLAQGTYKGSCFDDSKGNVAEGNLTLYNGTDISNETNASISFSDNTYKFNLYVANTGAATKSGESDTLGTFTVTDAK